jgi:hypothetical protein
MLSSARISADLLMSARTLEPSRWANSTTMFANAWTTEMGDSDQVEDVIELQRQDFVRSPADHLGESAVCEQDGAVLCDSEHRDRDPLQHNQGGQLLENSHR